MRIPFGTVLIAALSACSSPAPSQAAAPAEASAADIAFAEAALPADAALADIYARSCKACHAVAGSGAPLTGHVADWQSRSAKKSAAELVASVRNGLNTMPAMGYCADCSDADFAALITFMSEKAP